MTLRDYLTKTNYEGVIIEIPSVAGDNSEKTTVRSANHIKVKLVRLTNLRGRFRILLGSIAFTRTLALLQ
jgi:hypothetical protein